MAGPLSKEDIKKLLNAAAPILNQNELDEYKVILNELEEYYENEATIEDQNIVARWHLHISKNPSDAVRFITTLKSLNQGVDNVYPTDMDDETIGFYLADRQDYLDPKNGYSPAEKRRGLEDVDETYGFDVFDIPIFQDRNEDSLKIVLADAKDAWYSQDIRGFDLFKSYEESATQIDIIDRNNNRTSTPEEINTFVFDNSYSGNMTKSERSLNDADRWVYLDAKNDSALLRPDVLNEDDFLQLFLDKAVEAGRISPTVRDFMRNPDQEITLESARTILQDVGMGLVETQESYFTIGSINARVQVDLMMSEWATDQKAKIKNQHTNIMTGGEDFNKAISGFLAKDADDYVAIFGEQEANRQARQNLFDNYSWDPTKDIATNVKAMFSVEQTDDKGLIYNLNPNNKNWPKSLIDAFNIKNIQNAAGEAQRQLISNLANTEAGRRYLAKVQAGQTPTVQESFNVFNEVIEEIGENGEKFLTKTVDTLTYRDQIEYQKDKSDPKKMRQHAAQIVFAMKSIGNIDPDLFGFIDEDQLMRDLQNYTSFADALADTELFDDIIVEAKESKRLGAFDQDMGSVSGQKSAVNTILDNYTPAQKAAFDKAPDEQKNAVYAAIAPFGSGEEALLDPNLSSLLNNTINAGQAIINQAQFSAFQSAIPDYVLGSFKSRNKINANTSEDFYNHLQNTVIPNIEFRAQMVGVDSPDSLEKLIDSMLSGRDEEGNAVEYALPAYDYNQSDYDRQLGVTAADVLSGAAMPPGVYDYQRGRPVEDVSAKYDLSNLIPEIQPYAKTNPEFAEFMAKEMEKEGFMKEWQKATTSQPREDRGAALELQQDRFDQFQKLLADAQAAYNANPSAQNLQSLESAKSQAERAEVQYRRETGQTKFALVPPKEGADDPYQYGVSDKLIDDPTLTEEERLAAYYGFIRQATPEKPITETERLAALEKAKKESGKMMPTADEVFDVPGGAGELAKLMSTTPQTTPEFFRSQLPGFEKRYKESSFFTQEEERIKREQDREQQQTESQRRKQLRERPTGMSVFTRARR